MNNVCLKSPNALLFQVELLSSLTITRSIRTFPRSPRIPHTAPSGTTLLAPMGCNAQFNIKQQNGPFSECIALRSGSTPTKLNEN